VSREINAWLHDLVRRVGITEPDQVIGGHDNPYLRRWILVKPTPTKPGLYVHQILRDDDPRALHDHPWDATLHIVRGAYREITADNPAGVIHRAGSTRHMQAETAHRLEVVEGPVWTVCMTGPKCREWGFHFENGWVHWKDFVSSEDPGAIGPGCGGDA